MYPFNERKYRPEMIQYTKEVFEPHMGRPMTDDEARECIWRWSELLKIVARHVHEVDTVNVKGTDQENL